MTRPTLILTMLESPKGAAAAALGEYVNVLQPFDHYLVRPLQEIIPPVACIDYLSFLVESGPAALEQHLLRELERLQPWLLVWSTYNQEIPETVFAAAKRLGAHVIAITFDDEYRFDVYSKHWIPYVDFFITNAPDCVERYQELGGRATFIVPLSGERILDDWSVSAYEHEVSFIGRAKKDRLDFIQHLQDNGVPVDLFGSAGGRFLKYDEMNRTILSTKINLAFSKTIRAGQYGIKGRIFEAPLAGGFLLAEYFPGLERFYQIGKEMDVFRDSDDLLAKVRHYLHHQEQRETMARAGWERASRDYTATAFLRQAFTTVLPELADAPPKPSPPEPGAALRRDYARHNLSINRAFIATRNRPVVSDTLRLIARYKRSEPEYVLQKMIACLPTACWPAAANCLAFGKTRFKNSCLGRMAKMLRLVSWMDDSE